VVVEVRHDKKSLVEETAEEEHHLHRERERGREGGWEGALVHRKTYV
jgi:hypothetical protein